MMKEKSDITVPADSVAHGKLPMKRVLTMGLAGLTRKPFRLILSVLLAVMAFTFFCFALVSATTDLATAELKTAYANDVKLVVLKADSTETSHIQYLSGFTDSNKFAFTDKLTKKQIEILAQTDDCVFMRLLIRQENDGQQYFPIAFGFSNLGREVRQEEESYKLSEYYNPYNNLAARSGFEHVVELDPESGETDACLTPDSRLTVECHIPQNYNEIAITDYWADMYMRFGFKDAGGVRHEITSPDDLIGKTMDGNFTICGVYSTDEDREYLKQFDLYMSWDGLLWDDYMLNWLRGEHLMNCAFVCKGYGATVSSDETYNVLYKLSGDINKDRELIEKITYSYSVELSPEKNISLSQRNDYNISATFRTRYSGFADETYNYRTDIFMTVAIAVLIVFAIFSGLLLTAFLFANMEVRKRELGILRAMGARTRDIVKICIVESTATACIDFVLTLLATGIICIILNVKYNFWLFNIGIIPLLSLLLLCFGVATLATIFPATRLAKKKPVDVINER